MLIYCRDNKSYSANDEISLSGETLQEVDSTPDYDDYILSYEVLLDDKLSAESLSSANLKCLLVGKHWDTKTRGCRVWWLVLKQAKQTVTDEEFWERIGIGYFHEHRETTLELFEADSAEKMLITLI